MARHVTCRLTAKNRDQLRNGTLGNRVWATFTFFTFDVQKDDSYTGGQSEATQAGLASAALRRCIAVEQNFTSLTPTDVAKTPN